jgi:hypothetical protein
LVRCLTKGVQDDTSGQLEKGLIKEKRFQIYPEEFLREILKNPQKPIDRTEK